MFLPLFLNLRKLGVPVSPPEYLTFLEATLQGLTTHDTAAFYHLARLTLIKDETHYDRFDRAFAETFGKTFGGPGEIPLETLLRTIPAEWLTKLAERHHTLAERANLQTLGLDALLQALRDRLAAQTARHQGGSTWIGTAGTSPFGGHGDNPAGIRIGGSPSGQSATKLWDARSYRALDPNSDLAPRNLKLALRALRRWARDSAAQELDLAATIQATAAQGWLDVQTRPERRRAVKVLLFLDIGGSMDPYAERMQTLFAAARSEFSTLHSYYFHNCLYEHVWRDPARRRTDQTDTDHLLRLHGPEHRAIFVGDAAVSPYELTHPGGASEHYNPEPGQAWLARACRQWPNHLWINPLPQPDWAYVQTIRTIAEIFDGKMVPMTLDGISEGIKLIR